jgi:hypothetical protein
MIMKGAAHRLAITLAIGGCIVGLAHAMDYDRAAGMMPSAPPHLRSGQQEIGHTIEGEVVRIDGEHYFVEDRNGNEVRLVVNQSTLRMSPIKEGEQVEARVNNDDHVLSIRSIRDTKDTESDRVIGGPSSRDGK